MQTPYEEPIFENASVALKHDPSCRKPWRAVISVGGLVHETRNCKTSDEARALGARLALTLKAKVIHAS